MKSRLQKQQSYGKLYNRDYLYIEIVELFGYEWNLKERLLVFKNKTKSIYVADFPAEFFRDAITWMQSKWM